MAAPWANWPKRSTWQFVESEGLFGGVSGLVQRMEALHWVQRRPFPNDARTQRVWLLDAGRIQIPALKQALKRVNDRLSESFSDEELHTVARWLRHVQHLGDHPSC